MLPGRSIIKAMTNDNSLHTEFSPRDYLDDAPYTKNLLSHAHPEVCLVCQSLTTFYSICIRPPQGCSSDLSLKAGQRRANGVGSAQK